nr:tryptophan RNA-binding attenuator protein-like protein [Tanacetum cinerariifolium]
MAAPFFSTPFQPFVYQGQQEDVTPFQILGGEAQIVQIMLKPDEKINARPGCMCYMSGSTQMENVYAPENEAGMWQWLFGKHVTSTVFLNNGSSDGFIGIAAPSLARILPIDLTKFGGEILCQPDAFLCSIGDVKISNTFDQRARNVVPGVEGFLRQKLSGQGLAFIIGGGSVVQKNLEVGETLAVDMSSIVALPSTVNVQIKYNGPMRRVVFGGDNLVTAMLTGPGIVFIQSLPFPRLSQRIARAVTSPNMRDNPKIATAPIRPPREPIPTVQSTDKPVVTLVYTRKPRAKNVPNKMEPNKSWGSSSNVSTSITDCRLSKSSYGTVKFRNDHVAKIMGYGDYQIGNVMISRVYYVEGLGHNLFSVGQFCDSDLEVAFRQHTCFIHNLEGVDLLPALGETTCIHCLYKI